MVKLHRQYKSDYFKQIIKKTGKMSMEFIFWWVCSECKSSVLRHRLTKSNFIQFISYIANNKRKRNYSFKDMITCQSCHDAANKESHIESLQSKKETRKQLKEEIKEHIETFLTPGIILEWDDYTPYQKLNAVRGNPYNQEIRQAIKEKILSLSYQKFLLTPYWQAISEYKKYKSGYKCELCSSKYRLNTHHKSYNNHGNEHNCLEDLIILCNKCHSKFHNIVDYTNN